MGDARAQRYGSMDDVPTPLSTSAWPAVHSVEVRDLTVGALLREAAADSPDDRALVAGDVPGEQRVWTYAQLLEDAERVARALLARFEPGERVAIWAPNVPEWVAFEFGAALAGVVLVTVNPALRADEVRYVLAQSRSAGCLVLPEFRGNPMYDTLASIRADLDELREVVRLDEWDEFLAAHTDATELPDVDPGDPAQIQYTSGTTGFPKGALLHHRGIVNNAGHTAVTAGVERGAVWLNPMPLFHTGGCVLGALGAVHRRATHVLPTAFDPGVVNRLVESEGAAMMGAVPTMLVAMMEHDTFASCDLGSLRTVLSGGSTVPAPLVQRIQDTLGVSFVIVFGQTECSPVATMTRPSDSVRDKAQTIGRAMPGVEVRIVDVVSGETVPPGVTGELLTRGYHVMTGYFEKPEETAQAIDEDGWLHTGDLCAMDDRGYCTVEGRLKDMIIRGGENIYPREIEDVLFRHDDVGEVAVVGLADHKWGEVVGAFVRPAPGTDLDTQVLRAHVRDHLAPHKTPTVWVVVDEFPMTGSGKIRKFELRDRFVEGDLRPRGADEPVP